MIWANSLENPVENKYDIALTNIPFSQDLSRNIGNLYYDGLAKQSSDATCLLHCFKSLRPGGRMAAVVPEGFLSNRDVKETRKFLLDSTDLHSVVSLPGGCFAPYTMAKTCILYLKGKGKYTTCKFWFFSVTIEDESYLDKIFSSSFGHNDEIENEIMLLKAMSCKIENIKKPYYSLLQNRSQLKVDEKAKQSDFHDLKHETGKPHVYMGDFENFSIPIVSMADQKRLLTTALKKNRLLKNTTNVQVMLKTG